MIELFEYACDHPILLFVPAIIIILLPVLGLLLHGDDAEEPPKKDEDEPRVMVVQRVPSVFDRKR